MKRGDLKYLVNTAKKILEENQFNKATKPAPGLYPHQWNWDSCFIAIGVSHYDEERAQQEIKSLLDAQWSNGMIPHIVFSNENNSYFPGPEYWQSEKSNYAPINFRTSGITQPPIISFAALKVYENSKDKRKAHLFLKEIYYGLKKYHKFLAVERDFTGTGLSSIIHPWESGLDNSPRWDEALTSIKMELVPKFERKDNKLIEENQRPTPQDYNLYIFLVDELKKCNYRVSDSISSYPFIIEDIIFNSINLLSLDSLLKISEMLNEENEDIIEWKEKLVNGINEKLFDNFTLNYFDFDVRNNSKIITENLVECFPLIIDSRNEEVITRIINKLFRKNLFYSKGGYPFSSHSQLSNKFDPVRYWRGPIWINLNWLLSFGLRKHSYFSEAEEVVNQTLKMVVENGFFEYYNPLTGKGCGSKNFSWSAALVIDMIASYNLTTV